MRKRGILWFRQDLRLHDHEALHEALLHVDEIIPVYVFDTTLFHGISSFGFKKIDKYRTRFIIESVSVLREQIRKKGGELIIRIGTPQDEIFNIAREYKTNWVFCNRERTQEEVKVQDALEKRLWTIGQEMRYSRGKMLYYTADLPFPVTQTPDIFTHFRKEVEKIVSIRKPLPVPDLKDRFLTSNIERGEIPDYQDLGFENENGREAEINYFPGGEVEALKRLHRYIWEDESLKTYKQTRNGLLGLNYSSKLSPYLAQGCISPKTIYCEIEKYENEVLKNSSTYWLKFELLWRDFFRLMAKKHGNHIFKIGGTKRKKRKDLTNDMNLFRVWADGVTGIPFIDASMRELNTTGFMSNRARQNVASFLVNDLKVNWQLGAEYFESKLVDYDPASNWGNWNYIAGVGSDPRENRYFNIISQAKKYDPEGNFVRYWIPELRNIPNSKIHVPYLLDEAEQIKYNMTIGKDYPAPIVFFTNSM